MLPIRSCLDYETVWHERTNIEDVVHILEGFDGEALVVVLCVLNCILDADEGWSVSGQARLLNALIDPPDREAVNGALRRTGCSVVFWQGPILSLINLAAMYCEPVAGFQWHRNRKRQLGRLLLMMNEQHSWSAGPRALTEDEKKDELYRLAIREFSFLPNERAAYAMARNYELFATLPGQRGVSPTPADAFQAVTGVSLGDYIGLGCSLMAKWAQVDLDGVLAGKWVDCFAVSLEKWLSSFKRGAEFAEYAARFFAQSVNELGTDLRSLEPGAALPDRFCTKLRARPLLKLQSGAVVPSSRQLLVEKLTTSLYWTVIDSQDDPAQRSRLQAELGYSFHVYVQGILSRVFGTLSQVIHYGRDRREATDTVVFLGNGLLFVEAKSGRLRLLTEETGDTREYLDDMRSKLILRAATQIAQRIADFQAGGFLVEGLSSSHFRDYRAVIVTLAPLPLDPVLWTLLENQPEITELRSVAKLRYIHVMSAEELETVEGLCAEQGASFAELLVRKERWDGDNGRQCFKNFLWEQYKTIPGNRRLLTAYNGFFDRLGGELRSSPRAAGEGSAT